MKFENVFFIIKVETKKSKLNWTYLIHIVGFDFKPGKKSVNTKNYKTTSPAFGSVNILDNQCNQWAAR